jgi:pantoate--beta-alanine ligase
MSQPAIAPTIEAMRLRLAAVRQTGVTIGLVPTMGALHRGHARLIEKARHECSHVVVSIFVNPIQFDRQDDLARYPRPFEADVALCAQLGVHSIFAPSAPEMYPSPPLCRVEVGSLADHLCGAFRPGHFSGVATVVMKLLQIVQPHRAYFGEKDAQQLAVIRRMVAELDVPTTVIGVETIRDADGLAVSSRNQHLSADERRKAIALPAALERARQLVVSGAQDADAVIEAAKATVPADPAIRLEYLEVVDPHALQPVATITGPVLIAGAMWVGNTRLIDNITT